MQSENDFSDWGNNQGQMEHQPRFVPRLTIAIIVVNLLIFLGTDLTAFDLGDAVVEWGALDWQAVFERGEWYRVITSMLLHSDMEHVGNNMFILACIGYYLERETGAFCYAVIYFGSGILAGCTSMVYNMIQNEYVISIGASGAVFGTIGAMLFLVLFFRDRAFAYSLQQIAFMAFLGLYIGFANQGVDNAAHVGGFVGGFVLMGVLSRLLRRRNEKKRNEDWKG